MSKARRGFRGGKNRRGRNRKPSKEDQPKVSINRREDEMTPDEIDAWAKRLASDGAQWSEEDTVGGTIEHGASTPAGEPGA